MGTQCAEIKGVSRDCLQTALFCSSYEAKCVPAGGLRDNGRAFYHLQQRTQTGVGIWHNGRSPPGREASLELYAQGCPVRKGKHKLALAATLNPLCPMTCTHITTLSPCYNGLRWWSVRSPLKNKERRLKKTTQLQHRQSQLVPKHTAYHSPMCPHYLPRPLPKLEPLTQINEMES